MEKQLSLKLFLCVGLIFFAKSLFSWEVSQEKLIRFALWAEKEAYPGYFDDDSEKKIAKSNSDNIFSVPVEKLKNIAPFIVEGMVYGWKYEYTPYDKARSVDEYFDFQSVKQFSEDEIKSIKYLKPWIEGARFWCWIEYARTDAQIQFLKSWQNVATPEIKGSGCAAIVKGFDGIKEACSDAVKNAVREYWRERIKNKPKEISGRILLSKPPIIGIDAGRYVVTLDFFMETNRILEYKTF